MCEIIQKLSKIVSGCVSNLKKIIYYQISVILVLIVYHFENTHLSLVQKHSNFIYKAWTIADVHCKYIASDIIKCRV